MNREMPSETPGLARHTAGATPRIAAVMAVRNRRVVTCAMLSHLARLRDAYELRAIVVDDGSTDGTSAAIEAEYPWVELVRADGSLYWGGAMGVAHTQAEQQPFDYLLWLNDDATLRDDAIPSLLGLLPGPNTAAIAVGALEDEAHPGRSAYSGVRRHIRLASIMSTSRVEPAAAPLPVDSFNGNLVLMTRAAATRLGTVEPALVHHYGDFDYGFRATRAGIPVTLAPGFLGTASRNSDAGTFRDPRSPRSRRLRDLRSPKGYPLKQRSLYLSRHGAPLWPVQALGAQAWYLTRILIGR